MKLREFKWFSILHVGMIFHCRLAFSHFSLCEIPILRQTCAARVSPRRHRHQNPKVARRWRWPMWHLHRGSPGCCGGKCPGWPGDTKKNILRKTVGKMWRKNVCGEKNVLGRKCVFHKCKCKYVCIHMSIFYMYLYVCLYTYAWLFTFINTYTYIYIYIYIRIYIYMYTYIYMHVFWIDTKYLHLKINIHIPSLKEKVKSKACAWHRGSYWVMNQQIDQRTNKRMSKWMNNWLIDWMTDCLI